MKTFTPSTLSYQRLFETAPNGILIVDAHSGRILEANPSLLGLLGYGRIKLLGKKIWQIEVFKSIADSKASFQKFQSEDHIHFNKFTTQSHDGNRQAFEITSTAYLVDHAKVIQCHIKKNANYDVSEIKPASKVSNLESLNKLHENTKIALLNVMEDLELANATITIEKAKDEAILASIADAVLVCDDRGVISLFNQAAENLTGTSAIHALGKYYQDIIFLVDEKSGQTTNDLIAETIQNRKMIKMTNYVKLVRKDGSKVAVSRSAAPISNVDGTVTGCVVIFHDTSLERKIDQVKSEFVSFASHQLRTPLTTINWLSEKLLSGASGELSQLQRLDIENTHNTSKRMVSLVDSLLNVSKLEMGTITVEPGPVNIINLIETILKELQPKISKKRLVLTEHYSPKLTPFQADPKLLGIIILNLLSNAIKYTPIGGEVFLEVNMEMTYLTIKVTDTGIGIPKDQRHLVFTKLFRAKNAKDADSEGTGLGLYIVKSVLLNLGGEITFKSSAEKGTVFRVVIPLKITPMEPLHR